MNVGSIQALNGVRKKEAHKRFVSVGKNAKKVRKYTPLGLFSFDFRSIKFDPKGEIFGIWVEILQINFQNVMIVLFD